MKKERLHNIEITEDNYFEIAEIVHSLLTLWHDGKHGYVLLCRSQFVPGMTYGESDCEEYEEYSDIKALIENDRGEFLGYDAIEELLDDLNDFIDSLQD